MLRNQWQCLFLQMFLCFCCYANGDYTNWIRNNGVIFSGVEMNEDGGLIASIDLEERNIIAKVPNDMLFGLHIEEGTHAQLTKELLSCFHDSAYNPVWKPFCNTILQNNLEDIMKQKPALLWESDKLEFLQGTFLLDRIRIDIKTVQSIQSEYMKDHPNSQEPSIESIVVAMRVVENYTIRIVKNKKHYMVLPPVYSTLPCKSEAQTIVGFRQKTGMANIWIDGEYKATEEIYSSFGQMTDWRIFEMFGRYDIESRNMENRLPVDFFLRGYDKNYEQKIALLQKLGYDMDNEYPLTDKLFYIDATAVLSGPLMSLLRLKHYTGKITDTTPDVTQQISSDNEMKVYKEIINVLSTRLDKDFPTDVHQDQQELERRSTLKDPQKFAALAYRISEKLLLDAAMRRADFLKQGVVEKTVHTAENKQKEHINSNKDLI